MCIKNEHYCFLFPCILLRIQNNKIIICISAINIVVFARYCNQSVFSESNDVMLDNN